MQVKLATKHGFCFGVKRAIDCVLNLRGPLNTIGPLIHNPQFVKELEKKGIKQVDSIEEIDSDKVIIRTHGLPDKLIEELRKKSIEVIDLTCPFVKKVQDYAKELEKNGYQVIMIGKKGHPEVEGISANLKNCIIINDLEEAKSLKNYAKVGVVAQTTQTLKNFLAISDELKKHAKEIKLINTICNATQERQEAALKLAKEVDLMIVVGGHNSSNTKELTNICSAVVATKQIETESEIDPSWFKGKNVVGLSAGASTPDSIIKKIKKEIELIP